ncbi:hypothetical protein CJ030_MR5G003432 [Morella rubra]|uniref:Uncharacterized protein n=1 Tax=Morella rubra TaxID=262757 RepID=A0A6A1VP55_9ROSI|nr:hypothetical protein CJ030_MR5G003432 [Morella rubra]
MFRFDLTLVFSISPFFFCFLIQFNEQPANAVFKSRSAEPLRSATGVNQMKRRSDSGLGHQMLRITPPVKIEASDSPAKTQYKRKNAPQKVKVQEAGLTKTGGSPTSLLDIRDQRGHKATKLQLIEEGTSEAEDVQKAEVAAMGSKPFLSFSLKPQKQKEKRMIEPDTPQVQDAAFPSIGVVSKSSLIPNSKRKQLKSGLSSNIVILNQSLNGKVKKRLVKRGQNEVKGFSVAVMDGKSSVSESRKKGKRASNLPTTVKIRDSTVPMGGET